MSFSQEEFNQQLNKHLKKHGISFTSMKKSINWIKSSSPLSECIVPLSNEISPYVVKGSSNMEGVNKSCMELIQSASYTEELKDEVKDFAQRSEDKNTTLDASNISNLLEQRSHFCEGGLLSLSSEERTLEGKDKRTRFDVSIEGKLLII